MPEWVLVVADDQAVGNDIVTTLHQSGYHVVPARALPEVRECLGTQPVVAILLVAERLDRAVLGFCHELRETRGSHLVIMLVCAPGPVRDRTVALEVGADDVVVTPVSPDELRARLAVHLRRRRLLSGT